MSSKGKSEVNATESSSMPQHFAIPHPLKSANGLRCTPQKTTLSRSRSIPGLSTSTTPRASPNSVFSGTHRSGNQSEKSIGATKLNDVSSSVSKNSHLGDSNPSQMMSNCASSGNVTPARASYGHKLHSDLMNEKSVHLEINEARLSATPECFSHVHMETPRKHLETTADGCESSNWLDPAAEISTEDEKSNLTVGVRVRPLNAKEASDPSVKVVVSIKDNDVHVSPSGDSGMSHQFSYDYCFCSRSSNEKESLRSSSQEEVYSTLVHPLLDKAFEGYNACLFAYGQTGSGKSYSMMGAGMDQIVNQPGPEAGIIPRFCHQLFERIAHQESTCCPRITASGSSVTNQITVEISYFEMYNEKIHDLLGNSNGIRGQRVPLRVREHPVFGPYVEALSTHGVVSYKDLQEWILVGNSRRATAATEMNEKSSRSHSIFSVVLTQKEKESLGDMSEVLDTVRRSKINLVDLAGSERLSQTSASADRMREGVSINRSLLTLGKVIAALSEASGNNSAKKKTYIPYRDSVLTWLLSESLGGNSRTAMLATVSPASIHVEETLSTLRYATQAGTIVNRVRVNESHNDRLIRKLMAEVKHLRARLLGGENQRRIVPRRIIPVEPSEVSSHKSTSSKSVGFEDVVIAKENEMEDLRQRLKLSEEQLEKAERTWAERITEAEKCKSAEIAYLRRQGLAVCLSDKEKDMNSGTPQKMKQKMACLINLSPDPGLSGTLLYLLPPGSVRIGRVPQHMEENRNMQSADILLEGSLVEVNHCTIENNSGKLTLHTGCSASSDTFVNGHSVVKDGCLPLKHGDRLVIGGNHYFLINNPSETAKRGKSSNFVDFEFARQELKQIQEAKLRQELEEAKMNAVKELQRVNEEAEKKLSQQRSAFEKQIHNLGHALVQQKEMLENVEKVKRELENQMKVLEDEVEKGRERRLSERYSTPTNIGPYESNFFQDLADALNSTVILDEERSQDSDSEEATGLHEMQFMVKEANSLCRAHGINYEFQQAQVLDADGSLQQKVKVSNKGKKTVTYWTSCHFIDFLNTLRDYENGDSVKELFDSDASWDEDEQCSQIVDFDHENDGTDKQFRSSIVVETCITKTLNVSMSQLSSSLMQDECDSDISTVHSNCSSPSTSQKRLADRMCVGRGTEVLDSSTNMRNDSSDSEDIDDEVHSALLRIEEGVEDLLSIFSRVRPGGKILTNNPVLAIEDFEVAMHKMKAEVLNSLKSQESSLRVSQDTDQEDAEEIVSTPNPYATPAKSSLKSPCVDGSASKKVRFYFSDVN